ncbi:hypothetical protein C8J57DRAFT_1366352, partial [Mycena rebaudengoi]
MRFFNEGSSSASHAHASTHYHSNSNSTTSSARTRSEEADTEEDPVAPITPLPTTTRFDLSGGAKERDGARGQGKAESPFHKEDDGFVDVDAGRENDNGDDVEDDWVDPVPSLPVPVPPLVKKSKSGSGKSTEGKGKERKNKTKKAAAVPVLSVHYPFPVSVEDGATAVGSSSSARMSERGSASGTWR